MDDTDTGGTDHDARVREQFRLQAPTFDGTGFAVNGLEWIVERLAPRGGEQVLDVACGAAHLGRALAPHVRHVDAVDLTPEMLAQGDRLAREAGLRNVAFAAGNGTALPWLGGQFDLVVCRLALHQVADPAGVVREMVRVTRPGGRIGVTDIVLGDDDPADENTRLERLRDPSHNRTLSVGEVHGLLAGAGAEVISTDARDVRMDLEDWMERTRTPDPDRAAIRARLDDEIAGGPPTGLRPTGGPGGRTFTHRWVTVVAAPPKAVP